MGQKHNVLALVCLVTLIVHSDAQGQTSSQSLAASRGSAVANRGKYWGFVPKHERIAKQRSNGVARLTTASVATPEIGKAAFIQQLQPAATTPSLQAVPQVLDDQRREADGDSPTDNLTAVVDYLAGPEFAGTALLSGPASVEHASYEHAGTAILPAAMFWASAEYLYWETSGSTSPTLVTTSPAGTAQADAGLLDQNSTVILFGGDELLREYQSGGRYTLGMWLTPAQSVGVEVAYLALREDTASFSGSQAEFPILALPFFNVDSGAEDTRLVAFEGVVEGTLSIDVSSDFQTLETNLRHPAFESWGGRTDMLIGYRFAELEDRLRTQEASSSLSGPTTGTTFSLRDEFDTTNEFHALQIGLEYFGPVVHGWAWGMSGKFARGNNQSQLSISGQTTTTSGAGGTSVVDGGLFSQSTNLGTVEDDDFTNMAEAGITLYRSFSCGLNLHVGYRYFFWSDVLRASEQIDRSINPTQIPPDTLTGEARPRVLLSRSDFWAHGLSAGLEFAF